MGKIEHLTSQVNELEGEYRAILRKALTDCANGRWGLFGHNEHLDGSATPSQVGELRKLAQTINQLRLRIGQGQFPLHEEFEAARGPADANAPGEPKQAQAWLLRLSKA